MTTRPSAAPLHMNDAPTLHVNDAPTPRRFGPKLREARAYADKSMGDVARLLGVSPVRVSDVELERDAPFDDLDIGKIAGFLGVDPAPLWALAASARVAWEERGSPAPPPPGAPMISNAAAGTLVHVFHEICSLSLTLPSPRISTFEITGRPAPHPKVEVTWVFKPGVSLSVLIHADGEAAWDTRGWAPLGARRAHSHVADLVAELARMRKAMPS